MVWDYVLGNLFFPTTKALSMRLKNNHSRVGFLTLKELSILCDCKFP